MEPILWSIDPYYGINIMILIIKVKTSNCTKDSICNCSLTLTCLEVSNDFKMLKNLTAKKIRLNAAENRQVNITFSLVLDQRTKTALKHFNLCGPIFHLPQPQINWFSVALTFFKKWANPGLFLYLFLSFQTTLQILQHINEKKCPSSILCWDSNSQPLEHESPPITTRPGLPPH